ncbi:MAG: PstS family phosphate ABC transporter substrate-binding protein [Lentimicrobium sp.]|nr:PstS family phosphate ABC transporter substrate-binding protein [Lentimicrobium sp.]
MRKHTCMLIMATLLLTSCASEQRKSNTINLSGAFALYPMAVKWAEEYQKLHPEVRFNISGGGAGKGMADALAQTVDLGMFSREISPEEIKRGVWWTGVCVDAVIPTISSQNPFIDSILLHGITREKLRQAFITGNISSWNQLTPLQKNANIVLYTRSDACGAAETWAHYLGGHQENLLGVGIYGDPGLAEAVIKDVLGMGFNNTAYAYDVKTNKKRPGIEVIPLDLNANDMIDPDENFYASFDELLQAISTGIYPSPPARELYFVSKGRPRKQKVIDFLRWVITDGQQYVKEAGYVPLPDEQLKANLAKFE